MTSSSPWAEVRPPSCRIGHVLRHRNPPPEFLRFRRGLDPAEPAMYLPWTDDGPVVYLRQPRAGSRGCEGAHRPGWMWEGKLHDPPLAETDEQVVSAHGENPRPLAPTDFYDRSKGIRWAPCTHSPRRDRHHHRSRRRLPCHGREPRKRGTRRMYSGLFRALTADLGRDTHVATLQPAGWPVWFTSRCGEPSPAWWTHAWTRSARPRGTGQTTGPCCPTGRPRTSSRPRPAAPRCTSSGTPR